MKKNKMLLLFLCIILCVVYLKSRVTYTAYRSQVDGNFALPISKWNIKVDKKSLNTQTEREITIDDVKWDSTHTREGKVALGSRGDINIEIDPTDTGVAIIYKFTIIDRKQDPEKILTLNSVSSSENSIVRTGPYEYTGLITLDDIKNKKKPVIKLEVEWKDEGDYFFDPEETNNDNFIHIDFQASQYRGEEITEYRE